MPKTTLRSHCPITTGIDVIGDKWTLLIIRHMLFRHKHTYGELLEMKERIDDMVNTLNDSASQKMSRIKRVFEEAIGRDLAIHYFIKGDAGQHKKIDLDRNMVIEEL